MPLSEIVGGKVNAEVFALGVIHDVLVAPVVFLAVAVERIDRVDVLDLIAEIGAAEAAVRQGKETITAG